jgi:very-short-patch-repair endonuclease
MTIYEIGARYGVSGATIQTRLAAMGIARRTHSQRTVLALQNRTDNSLEREMGAVLGDLNIAYQRQKALGPYAFDFHLPDTDTLLECDGTFWHADPRFFPDRDRLYPVQKKTVDNDRRKTTYAANKRFKLIRFWEYDVFNNREWVEACLLNLFR